MMRRRMLQAAGGQLVVTPNTQPELISEAVARGFYVVAGVATPTEALAALQAGAQALKWRRLQQHLLQRLQYMICVKQLTAEWKFQIYGSRKKTEASQVFLKQNKL